MSTIFSKIVSGEIQANVVYEDNDYMAFLDVFPLSHGHTLVIPKVEIDYIFDMDDDGLGKMMVFAKKVAQAMKMAVPCVKIGVSVIGLEVPHAHIHLIPMNQVSDMNFSRQKLSVTKEELSSTAILISSYIK